MSDIVDDKSEPCIPFILERLRQHRVKHADDETSPPFFLGLNGVQGAGKTTLVNSLRQTLSSLPHSLPTAVLSIDDLYLPRSAQAELAAANPNNGLIQHRGEPGTHDVALGVSVFHSLLRRLPTRIPSYDKSAFDGKGDRLPHQDWEEVNGSGRPSIDVIIFEGWCVGFRALEEAELRRKWEGAREEKQLESRLWRHGFEELRFVNNALKAYGGLTDTFDALIHIDAENTQYVYAWRQEQEASLRASRGSGMTEEQVNAFVNGYYPAYELYTDRLRQGVLKTNTQEHERGRARQLRLTIGKDRRVTKVQEL
ncbi:MAG: hypothetical protein M1833_004029 [Piccolia ochrophora]|nr:MAG: hypothetical protein M1833_004029 [Piccolia ochrophora]